MLLRGGRKKILTVFGTRPEVTKMAPIIRQLEARGKIFQTITIASGQHTDLLYPFVQLFGIDIDCDLKLMAPGQTLSGTCARVLSSLDPILAQEKPDLILIQGDTTTAMAAALAGFYRHIPVGHVEAGLRSGDSQSPYPEEMHRLLITSLATYHFAATLRNRDTLLAAGVRPERIFVTGNPIVDSLKAILKESVASPFIKDLIEETRGLKRIVLTTHRRENFGERMAGNFAVLRRYVEQHADVVLLFPVHPNPEVLRPANALLSEHPRIHLIQPLGYSDFIALLLSAWLVISDSGGVQEEAPTLGKPLLILRENTERPEAVETGVARLVGGHPERLAAALEEVSRDGQWLASVERTENPFGQGDSGKRIAEVIAELFGHGNKR